MIAKLLTEHHLEFLRLKEAAQAGLSLDLSKCHIVGNLMHWLTFVMQEKCLFFRYFNICIFQTKTSYLS